MKLENTNKYYYEDGTTSTSSEREDSKTLHRKDGPAVEFANGYKAWYINGVRHREDGPAIEYASGDKEWYLNGEYHREDGPALEHINGTRSWYVNGTRHREDGPANEYPDGSKRWYINNNRLFTLTKEHLIKYMELKHLTVAHLLTDTDEMVRTSASKYDWKKIL